jgi:hypothetical protein
VPSESCRTLWASSDGSALYAVLTGIEYVVLAAYLGFFLDSPE